MNTQKRQYPRKLIFNLVAVAFLGWFILIAWTMTLWVRFGFNRAWERLYQLSSQQRVAVLPFHDASIITPLNTLLMKLPTERLSAIRHILPTQLFITNPELSSLTDDALFTHLTHTPCFITKIN